MGLTANQNCCSCGGGDYVDDGNEDIPTSMPTTVAATDTSIDPPLLCQDSPIGWHDIDGPEFNCQWYSEDTNCEELGSVEQYKNFGKTASEACCSCNGGEMVADIISRPSSPPSPSPASANICTDIIENWHDIDGEEYTVSQTESIRCNCHCTHFLLIYISVLGMPTMEDVLAMGMDTRILDTQRTNVAAHVEVGLPLGSVLLQLIILFCIILELG